MLHLIGAVARFKAVKEFEVKDDIKEGEIKLIAKTNEVITVDFNSYDISVINSYGKLLDMDEISETDKISYINISWNEGLSYISIGDTQLYQDEAQDYAFKSLQDIEEVFELSYNIDDSKYNNGELLDATKFELVFQNENGKIEKLKLI